MHEFARMGIECFEPKGAFYTFPKISEFQMTSDEFATRFLMEEKVAVVPGAHFYPEPGRGGDRIRFAFAAVKPDQAEEGALRLAKATPSARVNQPSPRGDHLTSPRSLAPQRE